MRFISSVVAVFLFLSSVYASTKVPGKLPVIKTESLPTIDLEAGGLSLSGFSSGGFAAVQLHVAASSLFQNAGVAVFAGGPYDCSGGSLVTAEMSCMNALPTGPDVSNLVSTTNTRASLGLIDNTEFLKSQRVFLFSGTSDTTVKQSVVDTLYTYYSNYIPTDNITYVNNLGAAHVFPTDNAANTNPCWLSVSPYISNCNFDGAGKALQQIYSDSLNPRNTGSLSGSVISFSQDALVPNGSSAASLSLADTGYAYYPANCTAANARCKVHLALHGCEENVASVGMAFVENAGYNAWADSNNIIVLYPQTVTSYLAPSNPSGCWDWWNYISSADGFDLKESPQVAFLINLITSVTGVKPADK